MKTFYFKCKLLTDIVLNSRAATEGNQESLDFIPGNNFLGIVANQLYDKLSPEDSLLLFHSGKVRFGDAHPEQNGQRALRIPACFYKSKLGKMEDGLYVSYDVKDMEKQEYKDFQPKQCRSGFYVFNDNESFSEVKVEKSFAIKSAYDREFRRSKDECMYGYESLNAGSEWIFEVSLDDDVNPTLIDNVKSALVGEKRIGRSRTAQYGLVKIEFDREHTNNYTLHTNNYILLYADARLIFLDEYGLPTFQPTAKDLGFEGGEIDWNKSQIRTFQYAPWNFKRQCRDADRCGIEKGSVFVLKDAKITQGEMWVGSFQNEGFGKVLVNPAFLAAEPNSNGKAAYKVPKAEKSESNNTTGIIPIAENDSVLIKYLNRRHNDVYSEQSILQKVNDFVNKNKDNFTKDNFASQWGTIRSIASHAKDKKDLLDCLFKEHDGYLEHGVACEKWEERGRKQTFKDFIDKDLNNVKGAEFKSAIINLAAEMAKISNKGGNK